MSQLSEQTCSACRADAAKVSAADANEKMTQLPQWQVVQENSVDRLIRVYSFKNFVEALQFTQAVGALAEKHQHHPALLTEWGKVTVSWWTHKINGLHENDFILAAKTDKIFQTTKA